MSRMENQQQVKTTEFETMTTDFEGHVTFFI